MSAVARIAGSSPSTCVQSGWDARTEVNTESTALLPTAPPECARYQRRT